MFPLELNFPHVCAFVYPYGARLWSAADATGAVVKRSCMVLYGLAAIMLAPTACLQL